MLEGLACILVLKHRFPPFRIMAALSVQAQTLVLSFLKRGTKAQRHKGREALPESARGSGLYFGIKTPLPSIPDNGSVVSPGTDPRLVNPGS